MRAAAKRGGHPGLTGMQFRCAATALVRPRPRLVPGRLPRTSDVDGLGVSVPFGVSREPPETVSSYLCAIFYVGVSGLRQTHDLCGSQPLDLRGVEPQLREDHRAVLADARRRPLNRRRRAVEAGRRLGLADPISGWSNSAINSRATTCGLAITSPRR